MRGLLMVECLYHQTIKGLKTQTRRSGGLDDVNGREAVIKNGKVVKPAIETNPDQWTLSYPFTLNKTMEIDNPKAIKGCQVFLKKCEFQQNPWNEKTDCFQAIPRYRIGEVLYIKEPTATMYMDGANPQTVYQYDMTPAVRKEWKWNNKLFMAADKARAYVRITGIRCERLLDISDDDAVAEGIERNSVYGQTGEWKNYLYPQQVSFRPDVDGKVKAVQSKRGNWRLDSAAKTPKESFISLYKFANKVKNVPNIWCWIYSFEYLTDYKPQL